MAGLADLRLLEAKTDQADRHARLEVEDITAKDAKSRQVTLAGADGKPLADLIVGKQNYTSDLNGLRGVYVRKPGNAQAWLAQGSVELPTAADRLGRPHGGRCRRGQDPAPAVRAGGRARR